ncbi:MAG TPA: SdpI family protein [Anaerolineales bacterium]|nr:SdpI family protein [Anaerolineales bacterium]HNQ95896.1 SdpI family protein [Anaerolineales bacterium]HNS61851.1 SdpI family protein [Anaerolineales bacterium]
MSTRTTIFISIILIAVATLAGVLLWNRLPDPMPSHWNAAGEVDDYMPKFWGVFLMPIVTVALLGLFLVIPRIDPPKANIDKFIGIFNVFIVVFVAYMLYVYALTLFAALDIAFNMTAMLVPVVGLLFIGIGYMMGKAKRNFFIGIRTPWTLSSETVWDETHKLGSKLFMLGGAVTILSAFLGETGIWIMLAAILIAAFVPIVYSYVLYQRETKS